MVTAFWIKNNTPGISFLRWLYFCEILPVCHPLCSLGGRIRSRWKARFWLIKFLLEFCIAIEGLVELMKYSCSALLPRAVSWFFCTGVKLYNSAFININMRQLGADTKSYTRCMLICCFHYVHHYLPVINLRLICQVFFFFTWWMTCYRASAVLGSQPITMRLMPSIRILPYTKRSLQGLPRRNGGSECWKRDESKYLALICGIQLLI